MVHGLITNFKFK